MKTFLIIGLLFSLYPLVPVRAQNGSHPPGQQFHLMSEWPPRSTVSVYFLRDMFTSEQRQAVLDSMAEWEATTREKGPLVTFSNAGETDGLIDCQNCLTVARQNIHTFTRQSHTSFNALRRNQMGQLISAWIGIDRGTRPAGDLRGLMQLALRGGKRVGHIH